MTAVERNLSDNPMKIVGDPCGESQVRQNWLNIKKALNDLNEAPRIFDQSGNFNLTQNEGIKAILGEAAIEKLQINTIAGPSGLVLPFNFWTFDYYFLEATVVSAHPYITARFDTGSGEGFSHLGVLAIPPEYSSGNSVRVYCPRGMFSNMQVGDKFIATQGPPAAYAGTSLFVDSTMNAAGLWFVVSMDSSIRGGACTAIGDGSGAALTGSPVQRTLALQSGNSNLFSISSGKLVMSTAGEYVITFGGSLGNTNAGVGAAFIDLGGAVSDQINVQASLATIVNVSKTRHATLSAAAELSLSAWESSGDGYIEDCFLTVVKL